MQFILYIIMYSESKEDKKTRKLNKLLDDLCDN